jgi:hypothetical protein
MKRVLPEPSGSLFDLLEKGESAISRVDTSVSRVQSAANQAESLSKKPASKVVVAIGIVAAVGAVAWLASKS